MRHLGPGPPWAKVCEVASLARKPMFVAGLLSPPRRPPVAHTQPARSDFDRRFTHSPPRTPGVRRAGENPSTPFHLQKVGSKRGRKIARYGTMKHAQRASCARRRVAPLAQCFHGVSRRLEQLRPFVTTLLLSCHGTCRLDGSVTVETHTRTCAWITRIEHAAAAMAARHRPSHGVSRRRNNLVDCQHNRDSSCVWL